MRHLWRTAALASVDVGGTLAGTSKRKSTCAPAGAGAACTAHSFDQNVVVLILFEVLSTLRHSSSTRNGSPALTPRANAMLPCSGAPGRGSAVRTLSVALPCRR